MTGRFGFVSVTMAIFLSACASPDTRPTSVRTPGTAIVPAAAETVPVATQLADAADDPAIFARTDGAAFRFAGAQAQAVILGTDKKAGLYVYGLDGKALQFLGDGLLNNVDLRDQGEGFVAGASDRGRMGVALYRFDPAGSSTDKLEPAGFIRSDVAEPYGFCMGRLDGELIAVLIGKDGQVRVYGLSDHGATIVGAERRRFAVGSQSEGCVVDDDASQLYIGEELKGVWRYPLRGTDADRVLVGGVGDGKLVADVEGVTLIKHAGERFLLVSSQGDSAFAVWRVSGPHAAYAGRFRVGAGSAVDAVTGTDGIDARGGAIGSFSAGLVVVQDDQNDGAQNFKLLGWSEILRAVERARAGRP